MRAICLLALLAAPACKSSAGVWEPDQNTYSMPRGDLEYCVNDSLESNAWIEIPVRPGAIDSYWVKLDGGHRTYLAVEYHDRGESSAFRLTGKSAHRLNWLTIGLMGWMGTEEAEAAIESWLAAWRKEYPPSGAAQEAPADPADDAESGP